MPSFDYSDIIHLPYPREDKEFFLRHPKMAMGDRAKIFSPFAALRGFSDEIDSTASMRLNVNRDDLLEDGVAELDVAFSQLTELLDANETPKVSITYFVQEPEGSDGIGKYLTITDTVKKVDMSIRVMFLSKGQIPLQDIRKITFDVSDIQPEPFR